MPAMKLNQKKNQRKKSKQVPVLSLIVLVRSSGLHLLSHGLADEQRFAEVFRSVWRTIPLRDKRKMVANWRTFRDELRDSFAKANQSPPARMLKMMPKIEILNFKDDWFRSGEKWVLAQCKDMGTVLSFKAAWVDALPEKHLATLVAHELAHVYQVSYLGEQHYDNDRELVEEQISDILGSWGFDQEALEEWEDQNSRIYTCESCGGEMLVPLHGSRKARNYEETCPRCFNRYLVRVERDGKGEVQVRGKKIEQGRETESK